MANERNERNNKIINTIMSGHAPVLLLCPSNPSFLDFLPDLFNNYRTTYTYNANWESQVGFVQCLAKKVLSKSDYHIADSFCRCNISEYKKVLLGKILSEISNISNDCLLFMCGLENLSETFDLSLLELLMDRCPENLKIVFCSTIIPHLSYKMDNALFPRIVVCDKPWEGLPFNKDIFSDGYLTSQQKEALLHLSFYRNVEKKFAEELYPGISELLNAIARNFRFALLRLGDSYSFHPDFYSELCKNINIETDHHKWNDLFYNYYYQTGDYEIVLERSFSEHIDKYINPSVERLFSCGKEDYIFDFYKEHNTTYTDSPIFRIIEKAIKKDKESAFYECENLPESPLKHVIDVALLFYFGESERAFVTLYSILGDFTTNVEHYIRLTSLLSYSEEKRLGENEKFIAASERIFERGTDNIAFLHYMSKINAAAGNYSSAKKFLLRIHQLCDYYRYSVAQSWTFFFSLSIEDVASVIKTTSNKLLECCDYLYHGKKSQAMSCLEGVVVRDKYCTDGMLSLALQSIFYAEAGNPEFGRSIALLYAVSAERESRGETSLLYMALAYCELMLRNVSRTLAIVRNCKQGHIDSFFSFLADALEYNCILETERKSVLDEKVEELLVTAENSGYDNAIVVLWSCFQPLLNYAEKRELNTKYVTKLYSEIMNKKNTDIGVKKIRIKLFGNASVFLDKKELVWKTKKSKELFLLYTLFPDGIERSKIISEIWQDYVYASAVNNLKTTNNMIRKTLKEEEIPFRFSYLNGKYTLEIDNYDSDYSVFVSLMNEYPKTKDLRTRVNLLGKMLVFADEGFAIDCDTRFFREIEKNNKENLAMFLSDAIKELIAVGDYLNAKRFLIKLEKTGLFDCTALRTEIDRMVYKK